MYFGFATIYFYNLKKVKQLIFGDVIRFKIQKETQA